MRKYLLLLAALLLISSAACGETALEYCAYLEEVLPDGDFQDAAIPAYCLEKLGEDYDFAARNSERYGSYIAGVRKSPAPEGAKVDSFSGSFEQRIWRVSDGRGNFLYNFALGENVHIQAYDNLRHLVIAPNGYATAVFDAASDRRARIVYSNENGFAFKDASRPQLAINIHNYESWKSGVTIEPTTFYLDVEMPIRILGDQSMSLKKAAKYKRTDVGVWLNMDGKSYGLVFSEDGVKGVEYGDKLYEAGPDFDRLMENAQKALGYQPGDMDFRGKKIVGAKFEWLAGQKTNGGEIYPYGAGSVEITDGEKLQRLETMLSKANYMLGSVNCPSNAFMIIELEDGTHADIAVAVNSFSTFFYRGLCFDFQDGDIIDLFNLKETVFYKAVCGG